MLSQEAAAWAAHRRVGNSKAPSGGSCQSCALLHVRAYATWSWPELVGKARTDAAFQHELLQAKKVMRGELQKDFAPETVSASKRTTVEVKKSYSFLTSADLAKRCGKRVNVEALGLPVVELADELGKIQKGVLVAGDKPRKVTVTNATDIKTETGVMLPSAQLRPGQGAEVQRSYEDRAGVLRGLTSVSDEELSLGIDTYLKAMAATAEPGAVPAPLQLAMQASNVPAEAMAEIEDDAEVVAARRLSGGVVQEQSRRGGKAGKSGRGGRGSQAKRLVGQPAPPVPPPASDAKLFRRATPSTVAAEPSEPRVQVKEERSRSPRHLLRMQEEPNQMRFSSYLS